MAGPMHIDIKVPKMAIYAARMRGLSDAGVTRALASALTFTAKDYVEAKRGRIERDIDRPHAFTKRAYNWDGVDRKSGELEARAFVRPNQAKYLEWTEFGGVKNKAIGQKGGPVNIRKSFQDRYGGGWGRAGFSRKWLNKSKARSGAKTGKDGGYAAGTKLYRIFTLTNRGGKSEDASVSGIWELTKLSKSTAKGRRGMPGQWFGGGLKAKWKTRLIVKFNEKADYDKPRLNFRRDGMRFGRDKLPKTAMRLLDRELAKLGR